MSNILVFAEQREGAYKKAAFEVLSAARSLNPTTLTAVTCGDNLAFAGTYGAAKVIGLQSPLFRLATPDGYAAALAAVVRDLKPDVVLFPHSSLGRDLLPRVAAILDVGCAGDATALALADGGLKVTRFANSG